MSRRLFNYILSLFGIKTEEDAQQDSQPTETYHPEDDAILITQKKKEKKQNKPKGLLHVNPRSRRTLQKKKKVSYLDWIPIDYLLSYIQQEQPVHQTSQPVDLSSDEEDDGTLTSEFRSLRRQVIKTCHALDTERPSAQFGNTPHVILPFLYERLEFIKHHYTDQQVLLGCIMLGVTSLETRGEVKRQLFESDWSRTLVLAISSLLKNFNDKEEEEEKEEWAMVLLDKHDWYSILKQMCGEFERLDPNWEFRGEYAEVVEMAARIKK
ncbi:hypothetical protein K501DRAFT_19901 [Backusella circina FSU 941]|nr:hypothetical protein K501DRAFT_19901 [Backusella circina FSU 941]